MCKDEFWLIVGEIIYHEHCVGQCHCSKSSYLKPLRQGHPSSCISQGRVSRGSLHQGRMARSGAGVIQ